MLSALFLFLGRNMYVRKFFPFADQCISPLGKRKRLRVLSTTTATMEGSDGVPARDGGERGPPDAVRLPLWLQLQVCRARSGGVLGSPWLLLRVRGKQE